MAIIIRVGDTITIKLTADEQETMDYVQSISSIFFSNFINNFLAGRKLQQLEELKQEFVQSFDRTTLKAEIAKKVK
jgi:predicted lysophospholipase L1 biosynthesis ABC-type transport system permease subunit